MAERGLEHRKGGVVTVVAVGDGEGETGWMSSTGRGSRGQ